MSATWFVAERLVLDVRQAVRRLGARPFFTLAALAILSVGIGLNTAAFSLARGLLLRPLPYPEPDAIVAVGQVSADFPGASPQLSSTGLLRLWDEARSFEHLSAHAAAAVVLDGPNGPTSLVVARVSPSFFPLLRAEPQLGRLFGAADAVDGAQRVCGGVFGTVALLLAAFGLYSVLGYMVSQRRRELGIRVALGAGNRDVLTLVLRQGGLLVGAGAVIGLLASAAATRVIESLLFGVRPLDPLTLAAVPTVLIGVGTIACWAPARRAARIDPVDVLRET